MFYYRLTKWSNIASIMLSVARVFAGLFWVGGVVCYAQTATLTNEAAPSEGPQVRAGGGPVDGECESHQHAVNLAFKRTVHPLPHG